MNEVGIMSVNAYWMDRNWAWREVQLTCEEVDILFISYFES